MMDKLLAEEKSVCEVFPDAVILLCQFHAHQSWLRAINNTSQYGVPYQQQSRLYQSLVFLEYESENLEERAHTASICAGCVWHVLPPRVA